MPLKPRAAGTLAGRGVVSQRPARHSGAARRLARPVSGAGQVKLLVKPKGRKRRVLNRTGRVTIRVKVTYTPTGGASNRKTKRIKLIKRRR